MPLYAYIHTVKDSGNIHLRVKQSHFDEILKDKLSHVGSPARWNQAQWEWDYPLTAAAVVALYAVADETGCSIEFAPDLIEFAQQQKKIEDYEKAVRLAIEKTIASTDSLPGYVTNTFNGEKNPLRHQQISYHWGVRVSGLLLAHDPGLGKSRSGIDISRGWYDAQVIRPMQQVWIPSEGRWGVRGGILVICPNNMQATWKEEFQQWQGMTALEITGSKTKKIQKAGTLAHAHIINYESLRLVLRNDYDAVIIDESHRCANYSGQTTNCLTLAQKALRRILLTGTPVSNSLESVFYQMLIVDGGRSLGANKTAFLDKWFDTEMGEGGRPVRRPKPGAVEAVPKLMSRSTYFLRKEEAIDLPDKLHSVIKITMTDDQARYYNNLKAEVVTYIQDSEVTVEQAAARMMKLRQVCQGFVYDDEKDVKEFGSAKVDALIDLIQNSLAGRKVVVWACFTPEIDRMVRELYQRGIGYVRMDGKVTKQQRDEAKHRWNTDPSITVLIGQIQMGIGLTLHANECTVPCYDCIYLGIDWSYVNWIQSQDRIHRIGQKYKCNYLYLLSDGGVDSRIYEALQNKAKTSDAVYKTGKDFFRSLIMEDTPTLAAID